MSLTSSIPSTEREMSNLSPANLRHASSPLHRTDSDMSESKVIMFKQQKSSKSMRSHRKKSKNGKTSAKSPTRNASSPINRKRKAQYVDKNTYSTSCPIEAENIRQQSEIENFALNKLMHFDRPPSRKLSPPPLARNCSRTSSHTSGEESEMRAALENRLNKLKRRRTASVLKDDEKNSGAKSNESTQSQSDRSEGPSQPTGPPNVAWKRGSNNSLNEEGDSDIKTQTRSHPRVSSNNELETDEKTTADVDMKATPDDDSESGEACISDLLWQYSQYRFHLPTIVKLAQIIGRRVLKQVKIGRRSVQQSDVEFRSRLKSFDRIISKMAFEINDRGMNYEFKDLKDVVACRYTIKNLQLDQVQRVIASQIREWTDLPVTLLRNDIVHDIFIITHWEYEGYKFELQFDKGFKLDHFNYEIMRLKQIRDDGCNGASIANDTGSKLKLQKAIVCNMISGHRNNPNIALLFQLLECETADAFNTALKHVKVTSGRYSKELTRFDRELYDENALL